MSEHCLQTAPRSPKLRGGLEIRPKREAQSGSLRLQLQAASPLPARRAKEHFFIEDEWLDYVFCRLSSRHREFPPVIPFMFARHRSQLRMITLAVVLCAMTGCGNPTIVGKWRMPGSSSATVWEFFKNGSILIGNVRGRYKFGDQNRVKIETPFATSVYQLEISGDRMILREPGGP